MNYEELKALDRRRNIEKAVKYVIFSVFFFLMTALLTWGICRCFLLGFRPRYVIGAYLVGVFYRLWNSKLQI